MGNFPVDKLSANEVLIGGKKAVTAPPSDGSEYVMKNGVWVQGTGGTADPDAVAQGTSVVPSLSGPLSGNETSEITVTIDNYDALNIYGISVTEGGANRTGNTIKWTLPQVVDIANHRLTVTVVEPGQSQSYTYYDFTVLNVVTANDAILTYENATMGEFTDLSRMSVVADELIASGTTAVPIEANIITDHYADTEIGDVIEVDGLYYLIDAYFPTPIPGITDQVPGTVITADSGQGVTMTADTVPYAGSFFNSLAKGGGSMTAPGNDPWTMFYEFDNEITVNKVRLVIHYIDGGSIRYKVNAEDAWTTAFTFPSLVGALYDANPADLGQEITAKFWSITGNYDRGSSRPNWSKIEFIGGKSKQVSSTVPVMPALIDIANLVTKKAVSNSIDQDIQDTDFSGLNGIEADFEFDNLVGLDSGSNLLVSQSQIHSTDVISVNGTDIAATNVYTEPGVINIDKSSYFYTNTFILDNLVGFQFSSDGTKMYTLQVGVTFLQYDLATPYDYDSKGAPSANYGAQLQTQSSTPGGFKFSPDGTKLYYVGVRLESEISQFNLSTPWDISTMSLAATHVVTATHSYSANDIFFAHDGLTYFIIGTNVDRISKHTVTTPWDISSTVDGDVVSLSAHESAPYSLFMSNDGTKLFTGGTVGLSQWDMSTPYDITTLVFEKTITQDAGGSLTTMQYVPSESKIYAHNSGSSTSRYAEFTFAEPLDPFTDYKLDTTSVTAGDTPLVAYKKDTKVYFDFGNGYTEASGRVDAVVPAVVADGALNASVTDIVPLLSSNTAVPEGQIIFSNEYSASYQAFYAFNSVNTDAWLGLSSNILGEYIGFAFNTSKVVNKYLIIPKSSVAPESTPKSWIFQASNDGVTWVDLHTVTDNPEPASLEELTFSFDNGVPYSQYRVSMVANYGLSGYVGIARLKLIEADSNFDTVLMTSSYTDVLDGTGGRTMTTKVKMGSDNDKMSRLTGTIQKLV